MMNSQPKAHNNGLSRGHIDDVSCTCCPDSLDNSSGSCSSSNACYCNHSNNDSVSKIPVHYPTSTTGRGKLEKQKSDSFTDLNANSTSGIISTKRRSPSMTSLSKSITGIRPFSASFDTGMGHHIRSETHNHNKDPSPVLYLTPLQRKEREKKEMKKELSKVYHELTQREEKIFQLQLRLEGQTKEYKDEIDGKINEIKELLEKKEKIAEETRQEKCSMEEELSKMDQMFTELKVKQKLQEDQFQERYLEMYKRGKKAAMFEREQELEMIASSKHPKVTVKELTRKLSQTESELAKWQSLRLDENYKSAEKPVTDADVTLSFLKDSFYHFVCDRHDCLRHFRAIVEIFKYSDAQMASIRKAAADCKEFNRLFKKDVDSSSH